MYSIKVSPLFLVIIIHVGAVFPMFGAKHPNHRNPQTTTTFTTPYVMPRGTRSADFQYSVVGGVCPAGHSVARPDNIYVCDHIEANAFGGGAVTFTVTTNAGMVLLTRTAAPSFQTFPVFCNAPPGTAPPPLLASGSATLDVSNLTTSGDATLFLQIDVTNNGCGPAVLNSSLEPAAPASYAGELTIDGGFAVQDGDLQNVGATATSRIRSASLTNPASQTIHVPLGLPFKWGMVSKTTPATPIPCDFQLSIFEQVPPPIDDQPNYPGRSTILFADRVLLPFGTTTPVNSKEFAASISALNISRQRLTILRFLL